MRNRAFFFSLFVLLAVIACAPVLADDVRVPVSIGEKADTADYPTVSALETTIVPPRDRLDLARRLLGVTDIPAPATSAPVRQVGEMDSFWVNNAQTNSIFEVEAELLAVGEHVYVWVETGGGVSRQEAELFASDFDTTIYEPTRALWGSEPMPGIDGDPRIYVLFADNLSSGVAAYFSSQNAYPEIISRNSNEHDMLIFHLSATGTQISAPAVVSVGAHEFQHMIRENTDLNEQTWIDEGSSMFTQRFLGYNSGNQSAAAFLDRPHTQLNHWTESGDRSADYGAAMLFITYLYERYGIEAIQAVSAHPADGMAGVDAALKSLGLPGADDLFADWVVANYLQDTTVSDGRYGYTFFSSLNRPVPMMDISHYPYDYSGRAYQYATDYFMLNNLGDKSSLTITLDAAETVSLVQQDAYSGSMMWYSNKLDDSDAKLTHAFDLTGVQSATLTFNAWYFIENLWDYAYLMVSTDDGSTWDILTTPRMTVDNPNSTAYGPGYTGRAEAWFEESVSLDAYAGQHILIRFEMITDDAVTQPGIVIDDVSIPEIGYFSDFEADDGGWVSEGWVRTDNRLPQQVWVQAVQMLPGGDVDVTRWNWTSNTRLSLDLVDGVDSVLVVVSPYAPLTTVSMPYTINFSTP